MADNELRIVGIEIGEMTVRPGPPHHHARVRFRYDLSGSDAILTANLLCQSALPQDTAPARLRADLVEHGLGQLRRMPEVWLGRARISMDLRPEAGAGALSA